MSFASVLKRLLINRKEVDKWFESKALNDKKPIYHSVDLRISDFKISPVDINCFPAGFNNISDSDLERSVEICRKILVNQKVVLVLEDFDRNALYLANINVLREIITNAGNICQLAFFSSERVIKINNNDEFIPSLIKENSVLKTSNGFVPDVVIINHDMTAIHQDFLLYPDVTIPFYPVVQMGWAYRRKDVAFDVYNKLTKSFCEYFECDSWIFSPFSQKVNISNFKNNEELDALATEVENMLQKINKKYCEYNITDRPYVVLKPNNGTHGVSILMISDAEQLYTLNNKVRKNIHYSRSGEKNCDYLLQEGVPTAQLYGNFSSETVLYHFNGELISQFYRYNERKCEKGNLNSVGAKFAAINENNDACSEFAKEIVSKLTVLSLIEECNMQCLIPLKKNQPIDNLPNIPAILGI